MPGLAVTADLLGLLITACGTAPQEVPYSLYGRATGQDRGYNMRLGLNVVL